MKLLSWTALVAATLVVVQGAEEGEQLSLRQAIQSDLQTTERILKRRRGVGIGRAWRRTSRAVGNAADATGDWIDGNVFDPIVDYYTWGKSDTKENLQEAATMIRLADQMYEEDPAGREGFDYKWSERIEGNRVGLFYNSDTKQCVVAYRGTKFSSAESVWTDLKAASSATSSTNGYKVSEKFYRYYKPTKAKVEEQLSKYTCSEVICTGHSLGGASAAIAQADGLCDRSITFEAPRVFKEGCDTKFRNNARRYFTSGIQSWNALSGIPNAAYDAIPSMPSGFSHCASYHVNLVIWSDLALKEHYNSEQVKATTPTTGANFAVHSAGNQIKWFRKMGYIN